MGTIDIILLVLFFGFVGAGFYFGLIHTLGAIIGVVLGIIGASQLYVSFSQFFKFFMIKENVAEIISFIILFIGISRLIGYMVHMFDKGFKLARLIPFATTANRFAGGLLGFVEATLVLGTILFVMSNYNFSPELNNAIDNSAFAGLLITIAKIVTPLVPETLKSANVPVDELNNYVN